MPDSKTDASSTCLDQADVVIKPFSACTFNDIADYHDVRHIGEGHKDLSKYIPKINEIGQVYLDHDMQSSAALALIHRHFALEDDELKVAKQVDNEVIIEATKRDSVKVNQLIPYVFGVVRGKPAADGKGSSVNGPPTLIPLEYADHSNNPELEQKLRDEYNSIQKAGFLNDFLSALEKLDVQGVFGIMLNSRDNLATGNGRSKLESGGGNGLRRLVVRSVMKKYTEETDITTVVWRFRKGTDGRIIPYGVCSSDEHTPSDKCNNHTDCCTGRGHSDDDCTNHCLHCEFHKRDIKINAKIARKKPGNRILKKRVEIERK